MTKNNRPHEYSKKTIFRVVGMHFLMMFIITAIQVIILQSLLTGNSQLSQQAVFVVSIQVLFLAAALYGSGIYITAILFETFVTRKYLVIRFLHGPLSHTIIYTAYLGTFGNVSFINNALSIVSSPSIGQIFIAFGILTGIVAAIGNYANGILMISIVVSAITFAIFLFLNVNSNNFALLFEGYEISFLVTGTALTLYTLMKGEKLSWYKPINIFQNTPLLVKRR